ncbi:cell division protein FtsZ [Bacillus sp. SCS-151]|uniref:cell division protein FtsZ n=1 Tax=Nanhaiella sioensis TaxID=3115293 RepID=UPI00397993E4
MSKSFIHSETAINMTLVGFGQAGGRMVDEFASIRRVDGTPVYNCLALNANTGDLEGLKHIPNSNWESLNLGGLGKNPERALEILEDNEEAKVKLKKFIQERIRPEDELILFFAGLGGGTGTSTIVKAIEEFYEFNNKPKIKEELLKIQKETTAQDFKTNLKKYMKEAVKRAERKFVKIGVVTTLPLRADGPDVLRQVNNFATKIWELSQDKTKGIAFPLFIDNQYIYDQFKAISDKDKIHVDNYRDYANKLVCETIHELNTAATVGGTEITLDSQDFRRTLLEHRGCLVINRLSQPMKNVKNGNDVKDLFLKAIPDSSFHEAIELTTIEDGQKKALKVHHVGLLAVLDQMVISKGTSNIGSSFVDDARVEISESLPLAGTVFPGYIEAKNDFNATVYTFYKTEGLPKRLAKGLVKEFEEFQEQQKQIVYAKTSIQQIDQQEDDDDFDIDLSEFGIEIDEEPKQEQEKSEEYDVNIDDLDFSKI